MNEAEAKRRKEVDRILKQKRDEKVRGEADWQALVGNDRVEEEGVSNEDGWVEDDFM